MSVLTGTPKFIADNKARLAKLKSERAEASARGDKKAVKRLDAEIAILERVILQAERDRIDMASGGFTRPEKYREEKRSKCK